MTRDMYNDWMAIDEHIIVTATFTGEHICEALTSTSKALEEDANEDN